MRLWRALEAMLRQHDRGEPPAMEFDSLFKAMVDQKASDLFLKSGSLPCLRVDGKLNACGGERLTRADLLQLADELMGPDRQQLLQHERELNFAFHRHTIGRFRANVLWQQGSLALVIRRIQEHIPSFEELCLPAAVLRRLAEERQGMLLITGPTASGKSTTTSSVLEYINQTKACHIVTLEDPIEYLFEEDQAIINQREVGVDTRSFSEGLKNVLRQSPDVLYLSDLRDQESMEAALLAAESGQMVISCIHTTNAVTTIERMVAFFPPHQHELIRFRLSMILKGIVSLRLLPRRDRTGQIPACEVLVMTPTIQELVREARVGEIPMLLRDGGVFGMQTQTQALYQLVAAGVVMQEEALKVADSPGELELALRDIRATKDVDRYEPGTTI